MAVTRSANAWVTHGLGGQRRRRQPWLVRAADGHEGGRQGAAPDIGDHRRRPARSGPGLDVDQRPLAVEPCDQRADVGHAGLALFTVGMWLPSLPVFVIGGIITGAGGGLVFRGSLVAAASTAPSGSRAEVLAGFFLGGYMGLSAPVIALGVATEYVAARDVMLVFVVLAAIAIAAGTRAVMRHQSEHR